MIHCQNCTTRNSLDRDFCWKCGSKLLVPSGAVAVDSTIPFLDEHVLERISALEYTISMLSKRVDSMMETVERVAASNFIDHTMIETLTDSLESAGIDLKIWKPSGEGGSIHEFWKQKKSIGLATGFNASSTATAGPIENSSHCGWKNRMTCWSPTAAPKASTS